MEVAFDYIDTSGSTAKEVTKVPLAPEGWLLASSPPSAEDLKPNGNGSATEFDYAVLRLKTRIGQSGILRAATTFASQRGWLHLPEVAQALLPGSDVIILQHPLSETLKLSLGRITPSSAVARVRYDATTAGGSSGSVVLNSALEAVALHHCGDPTCAKYAKYNQGVLLDLVKMDLRNKGILL